ncbi:MAG: Fe-S-binding domain-containing protein, partial [Chloroflexi bacterium]|nr:Fe-S-binding domain-containing protein [Chloroflexota bacterium]
MSFPVLSIMLFTPAIGAIVIALLNRPSQQQVRGVALAFSLLSFLLSVYLFIVFDRSKPGMQFEEILCWLPAIGSSYHLGIDGISLIMTLLTTLIGVLVVLVSW